MFILGLAGQAGVGKDTVADYLVKKYGFVKFAFSDAIYHEVQLAYGLEDQSLLRDRSTKEIATPRLAPVNCQDDEFIGVLAAQVDPLTYDPNMALSPRQILQWWGTEYRRAQDPDYWVKRSAEFVEEARKAHFYSEHAPQYFVNTTTRFENEREWIHSTGGNVWHIHREGVAPVAAHVSENALPVWPRERSLWNNDTIERLHRGVEYLLATHAKFVRVEPMEVTAGHTLADKTESVNAAA